MQYQAREALSADDVDIVLNHMTFAKRLAWQFYQERLNTGVEHEEFEAAALLGLCDAARRFNPKKGVTFRTFSYFRIRGAMFDLLRRGGWIPRKDFEQLIDSNPKLPEEEQKADLASCSKQPRLPYVFAKSPADLASLAVIIEQLGLKIHVNHDRNTADLSYADAISPEEVAVIKSTKSFLRRVVSQLPERERRVIELRYFQGCTFEEMRAHFGAASKMRITKEHLRALDALKTAIIGEMKNCRLRVRQHAG